ncbi:hypothetical protein HY772_10250 [Candidatus Woesearchaeota archaeon]|nr:hypothetical protein [Candidatus Woesearchaeota archaeon]
MKVSLLRQIAIPAIYGICMWQTPQLAPESQIQALTLAQLSITVMSKPGGDSSEEEDKKGK